LLFGSDFPFFTPAQTAEALHAVADNGPGGPLPRIEAEWITEIIERDSLGLLDLE
jgi:hypothetical protein